MSSAHHAAVLAAYLICLIVGGVFVGLSVMSGLGKDLDAGHEGDLDGLQHVGHEGDLGGLAHVGHEGSLGGLEHVGHEGDLGGLEHAGHEGDLDGLQHVGHAGEHGALGHGAPGEGGIAESAHAGRPRRWLPFTSLRFWTFGAFFFGVTGLALTELSGVPEPIAGLGALGAGLGGGLAAAALVHQLRKSVGTPSSPESWTGVTAELLLPLAPGGLSKVRVTALGSERDLLVALADPSEAALPKGTRVVILRLGADGRALVEPEGAMFPDASPSESETSPTSPEKEEVQP